MSPFGLYARYYDLIYREKDYGAEARFVSAQLRKARPEAATLLELGCGTGRHALAFAELDWRISGVDLSTTMIESAQKRRLEAVGGLGERVAFQRGDVRAVRLGRQFDCATSLFHVMNYQTTNEDLAQAFATVAAHLVSGGLFFFDFWHGPGVLADPPTLRVKRLQDDAVRVTRIAEPELRPAQNVVVVNYDIFLEEKSSGVVSHLKELHAMRYLFPVELSALMQPHGLELVNTGAWMDAERKLGPDAWYGWAVARLA